MTARASPAGRSGGPPAAGVAGAILTWGTSSLATSRCPPGTGGRPALGLALALLGLVLGVWLAWGGALGARLGARFGRFTRVSLDVVAGALCLALGAFGFVYFALRCFQR